MRGQRGSSRASSEGRPRRVDDARKRASGRPPQDDAAQEAREARSKKKQQRRHGPDSVGEPERARRERRHGRRPFRGKPR
jgi:hypothetical protein